MFSGNTWPGTLTIDSEIAINNLKNGCSTNSLLSVGSEINGNTSLKISSIVLKNLKNLDTVSIKVAADLVISFDENSKAGPLKPITISNQMFNLTGSAISSCIGVAGMDKVCTTLGGTWNGSVCAFPPSGSTANSDSTCANTYGVGWTWNGSACIPPSVAMQGSKIMTVGTFQDCPPQCSNCGDAACLKANANELNGSLTAIPAGFSECLGAGGGGTDLLSGVTYGVNCAYTSTNIIGFVKNICGLDLGPQAYQAYDIT